MHVLASVCSMASYCVSVSRCAIRRCCRLSNHCCASCCSRRSYCHHCLDHGRVSDRVAGYADAGADPAMSVSRSEERWLSLQVMASVLAAAAADGENAHRPSADRCWPSASLQLPENEQDAHAALVQGRTRARPCLQQNAG